MYSRKIQFQSALTGIYLRDVLQKRARDMRAAIERDIRGVLQKQTDERAYLDSIIRDYSITVPNLDFDPEHITKTDEYEQVHGSRIPGEVIFPDRMYRVWVVTFSIPYTGNIDLLQYVPRSGGTLSYPEVFIHGQSLCFKVRTVDRPEKDIQKIKAEKETIISFLKARLESIVPELEEYNNGLARDAQSLFESLKQKYHKDHGALDQL
jgi:hypothetical protein